ncbi:hypothetical protein AHF37_11069 [Paragonimus kellicotti]|nr:hypothetical protein AHF37_11069 [Paragonimus kellicotti]
MHLHFNSPMSGVCLWPSEATESRTSPRLFAADVFERKIHTFILPDEPIAKPTHSQFAYQSRVGTQSTSRRVVSPAVSFQSTSVGSSVPIVLSGFTDVISSHHHSFQQQHSLQQPSLPTQRRLSRRTRGGMGVTLRFTPGLIPVASTTEAQDSAEETPQQTSYLSPANSISLLRGGSRVQLSRVTDSNIMMVSYSDGVVELIEVVGEELNIIKTVAIHERNQVDVIIAEFCGDLSTLISCGHDGLLVCTEIPPHSGGKLVSLSPVNGDLLERSQKECKELTMLPTYQVKRRPESPTVLGTETEVDHSRHNSTRPLFGRSSTVMTVAEQSIDVTDTNESDSEALEVTPIVSEPHRPTWTEECEKDAHALEDQVYTEAREKLRGELAEIRKTVSGIET